MAFEEIKYSGIDYLGNIPSHWELWKFKRLTSILTCGYASTPDYVSEENGVPFLSAQNVKPGRIVLEKFNYISKELHKELTKNKKPLNGDVLIARVGGEGNIGDAAIVDLDFEFSVYVSLAHIRTRRNLLNKFLIYFFQSDYSKLLSKIETQVGGGVGNLNVKDMERYKIAIPEIPEQTQIVKYLDYKTGLIDDFIASRKKQMDLLREQKAGIINKAVTKGIDPNVKMKPSGIAWIGDVPEHWKVGKVRRVLSVLTDFTANGSFADLAKNVNYLDYPDFSRLIRLTDLREDLKNDGIYVSEDAHKYLRKSELFGGEILMANVGAYAGLVCLMPKISFTATLGPNMFLLKFDKKLITNNYAFELLGCDAYNKLLMNKALSSAQPKLNKEDVKSIDLVFPPTIEEQIQVLEFVREETASINDLISKYHKQIELMQEYRTAIISQVVTGKIDVREWKPKAKEDIL